VLMDRGVNIRTDLTPGDHILRCEVLEATADPGGGHEFRIISVMRYVLLLSSLFYLLSSLSSFHSSLYLLVLIFPSSFFYQSPRRQLMW